VPKTKVPLKNSLRKRPVLHIQLSRELLLSLLHTSGRLPKEPVGRRYPVRRCLCASRPATSLCKPDDHNHKQSRSHSSLPLCRVDCNIFLPREEYTGKLDERTFLLYRPA